jgi:hypothetical protein
MGTYALMILLMTDNNCGIIMACLVDFEICFAGESPLYPTLDP